MNTKMKTKKSGVVFRGGTDLQRKRKGEGFIICVFLSAYEIVSKHNNDN